jgi:two-component system sensor histidine kinase/response regulator
VKPAGEDKVSILLVDDRDDKRLSMEAIIEELGQNIVKASSGREALRCLLDQDFALILLDVNMPGMDGFETAHLIRQRKRSEHTPIIFVTGISDTETHLSRGYSLGAVDYILTPVVPEVLRAKVSVFVELFKVTQQVKNQAEHLRRAHDELEVRVTQRTVELAVVNESLQAEIAERQRAEEKIRGLNVELEKRVLERTAELLAANQELETFTYSIAHDLRAPLRQIHGYAQILEEEFASAFPEAARRYLKRIGERGRSMGQMVDDLLNLSGISRQEFQSERVNLGAVVREVIAELRPEVADRKIEWQIEKLPWADCHAGLIKQVFTNLFCNAIKYTRSQPVARIEVGLQRLGEEAAVYVRDNGVGFDMKYVDRLFGVFQRLHRAEDFEGTGIGLAIVARIVRRHDGRIWAEGKVGEGAAFYFTLGKNRIHSGKGKQGA